MAHIKIKYVEPMCTLYLEASWRCLDDEAGDGDDIRLCPNGMLAPIRHDYIGKDGLTYRVFDTPRCEYASRKEIEKEGNFKSWTLEKNDEDVISLMLGKTYIEGDNISYLEIDEQVLVKEIMKSDDD